MVEPKSAMRGRMAGSPLCDAATMARAIEDAYRSMWHHWFGDR